MKNSLKDYESMTLEELGTVFLGELHEYKSSLNSERRCSWMSSVARADRVDIMKLCAIKGYLMAVREYGHHIGDLEIILEMILDRKTRGLN